jgi:hypothetical protein
LLPKAKNYVGIVAVTAVLGALLAITETVNTPAGFALGWAMWPLVGCSVVQALVAVAALLLDSGVITAPAPRLKYDPYAQYGQYGQYAQYGQQQPYYGQQGVQQPVAPQSHSPQHSQQPSGYGSQYGGYPSSQAPTQASVPTPSSGGFGAQPGHQVGAHQQGPSTPPTGFPSFSPPPSAGASGAESQAGSAPADYSSQAGNQQSHSHEQQQSPSSSSGPAPL